MNYPSLDTIREVHRDQVDTFGGDSGVRDPGALKSAHKLPLQSFGGEEVYPTIHEKAAAMGHGIIANHPFVDGNKRTGAESMILLLEMNGYRFESSNSDLVEATLKIAQGTMTKEKLAEWLKDHTTEK